MKKCVLICGFLFIVISNNFGATITSSVTGNWSTGSTWSGGSVPLVTDNVIIANGTSVTVTGAVTAINFTVNATGTLTINSGILLTLTGGTNNGTLNGGGNLSFVIALAAITNNGTMNVGSLAIGGGISLTTFNNNAGATLNCTSITLAAISTINNSGTITNTGNLTVGAAGTVNNNSTITVSSLTLNGALFGSNFNNLNGSTLFITGLGTPVSVAGAANLNCNNVSNLVDYSGAGAQNIYNTQYYNLTISGSGAKSLQTATQIVINNLLISAGSLNSNGFDMTVGGNWTNNATFTQGTKRVTLDGTTAAQTVGGTTSTTFYNLTINNTLAATPVVILGIDIAVTNGLTMTSGITNMAGFRLTLGTSGANIGTLVCTPSNTNFMYGGNFSRWFTTATIAAGNVAGLFPMGNASSSNYYASFYVTPSAAPTTGGSVTVTYNDPGTVSTVSFSDAPTATLIKLRNDEVWGVTTGSLAGGTYLLRADRTFTTGGVGALSDLRLTLVGSTTGASVAVGGALTLPQVSRSGITFANLANNYYIGSINAVNSPLPIELLHFDAVMNENNKVDVTWATATEKTNDYFRVQRSSDGINFLDIARVKGAGNSLQQINYKITDDDPLMGISYYRLMQTDFDKTVTYSDIRSVNFKMTNKEFVIYPNPAVEVLNVAFKDAANQIVTIKITDITGKEILNTESRINEDGTPLNVDLKSLANGVYFISVMNDGAPIHERFVKQ